MRLPHRVPFGPWVPDVPELPLASNVLGVRRAENCMPARGGYRPFPQRTPQPTAASPTERPRGVFGLVDYDGTSFNFLGTSDKLYVLNESGLTDVSKVGGYTLSAADRWEITAFGNLVLAATPNHVLQYADVALLTGTPFADVTGAPQAQFVEAVRDHVFCANLLNNPALLQWSAINDPTNWPTPGTDAAIAVQSGQQELSGPGGNIMGLMGGAEVGAVFQERSIWRMDYVGGDVMWSFARVEPSRGMLAPNCGVDFGREILFLSQDGFYRFDYTVARPVGQERIDRYVLDQIDLENLDRVRMVVVPSHPLVAMAFPGEGSSNGVPNKVLLYHWWLDQFTILDEPDGVEGLFRWQPFTESLDSPPPDEPLDAFSNSFDDALTRLADQRLAAYSSSHDLSTFDGAGRAATIETGIVQLGEGRSFVTEARPLVEGLAATVGVAGLARISDDTQPPVFGSQRSQEPDGKVSLRSNARYHLFRVAIPAGSHGGASGLDVIYRPAGRR